MHMMNDVLREIFEPEFTELRNKALQEGREAGMRAGREAGMKKGILSLMETLKLTSEQAMDALNIPEDERAKYANLIRK